MATSAPPNQPPNAAATAIVGTTCMELAIEGERLCKTGDFKNGVRFFEEAIKLGTNEDRTLSAIYSQLGNAYFYLEDYQTALDYHEKDVALVHKIGDQVAEAKACGNLGNTLKMLDKFKEAAVYCRRYLEISRSLNDRVGEGRALYNLGNVYHTQGKRMIGASEQDSSEMSNDIKWCLKKAIEYYQLNLEVVSELNDYASMGRACGNLGNTHYLLGNFEAAVESHKKRLELAVQTNDKSAERRAHLNLGNANVFLGNFSQAIENYSSTLKLAQELQDKYTEAHSCSNLANTYTLLRDYKSAIEYHLKYLEMINEFDDKLGEGRACWSLVNIYQMVNDPESALTFAKRHSEIAEQLGDKAGLASAKSNIEELEEIISHKQQAAKVNHLKSSHHQHLDKITTPATVTSSGSGSGKRSGNLHEVSTGHRLSPDKRQEQEQRRFKKQLNSNLASDIDGLAARRRGTKTADGSTVPKSSSNERLFDMIAHFQSGRIDDQRCEVKPVPRPAENKENVTRDSRFIKSSSSSSSSTSSSVNSSCQVNAGPINAPRGSQPLITYPINAVSAAASAIKATYRKASLAAYPSAGLPSLLSQRRPTVSAEHRDQLFDLIAGAQTHRMDEQRAALPRETMANGLPRNPPPASQHSHFSRAMTVDRQRHNTQAECSRKSSTQTESRPESRTESRPESRTNQHQNDSHNINTTDQVIQKNPKPPKLTKHYQTVDSEAPVQDEKFLDSLMKYQSSRFDDQRTDFPKKNHMPARKSEDNKSGQADNFFNLIVRFQSDRIDDQRSAPPAKNKDS